MKGEKLTGQFAGDLNLVFEEQFLQQKIKLKSFISKITYNLPGATEKLSTSSHLFWSLWSILKLIPPYCHKCNTLTAKTIKSGFNLYQVFCKGVFAKASSVVTFRTDKLGKSFMTSSKVLGWLVEVVGKNSVIFTKSGSSLVSENNRLVIYETCFFLMNLPLMLLLLMPPWSKISSKLLTPNPMPRGSILSLWSLFFLFLVFFFTRFVRVILLVVWFALLCGATVSDWLRNWGASVFGSFGISLLDYNN